MGIIAKMKKNIATHKVEVAKKKAIRKAELEKQRAEEEARQKRIVSGKIVPMKTDYNLDEDEEAYISFSTAKMGQILHTVDTTHKQGVAGRAGCGCCLFGPLGALLGGATAPSKTNQHSYETTGGLDHGTSIFTDKRIIFIGQNTMKSLPYKDAISIGFTQTKTGSNLQIKYTEMVKGEHYLLFGPDAKIAELWLKGIKEKTNSKLLKKGN